MVNYVFVAHLPPYLEKIEEGVASQSSEIEGDEIGGLMLYQLMVNAHRSDIPGTHHLVSMAREALIIQESRSNLKMAKKFV